MTVSLLSLKKGGCCSNTWMFDVPLKQKEGCCSALRCFMGLVVGLQYPWVQLQAQQKQN